MISSDPHCFSLIYVCLGETNELPDKLGEKASTALPLSSQLSS